MEARVYIQNELDSFIRRFSKTRVRYEYDADSLVHIVEVLPNEVYHLDRDYIEWEEEFYNRFVLLFPAENICFISDDALVEISSPELVLEGLEYAPITSSNETSNILSTDIVVSVNNCFDIPLPETGIKYMFNDFIILGSPGDDNILKAA